MCQTHIPRRRNERFLPRFVQSTSYERTHIYQQSIANSRFFFLSRSRSFPSLSLSFSTGIIPPLITVSIIKSVSFSVYESSKTFLRERSAIFNGESLMSVAAISTLAGAASGSFIATFSCPLELVKIQKQLEQLLLTSSMATGGTIVRGENSVNGQKVGIQRTDVSHKVGAGLPITTQSAHATPGSTSRPAKTPNMVVPATNIPGKVVPPNLKDIPKSGNRPANGASTSSWYSAREIVRLKGIAGLWSGYHLHFRK
jgi:hypothetical protein